MKNTVAKVLNKLKIPTKDNLDIPRRNMPQIKNKHMSKFRDWIESEGIPTKEVYTQISVLKPTQKDFNTEKVMDLMHNDSDKLKKVLLISNDNYILDGHHKWLAHLNMAEKSEIKCLQVDLSAKEFLNKAKYFPRVRYKDMKDNEYKKTDPKLKYAQELVKKVIQKIAGPSLTSDMYLKIIEKNMKGAGVWRGVNNFEYQIEIIHKKVNHELGDVDSLESSLSSYKDDITSAFNMLKSFQKKFKDFQVNFSNYYSFRGASYSDNDSDKRDIFLVVYQTYDFDLKEGVQINDKETNAFSNENDKIQDSYDLVIDVFMEIDKSMTDKDIKSVCNIINGLAQNLK